MDGNAASPTNRTGAYPGAFIYGWALDTSGSLVSSHGTTDGYVYSGRAQELGFPIVETPTSTCRGGAFYVGVTPVGKETPFQRFWISSTGNAVFAGRSVFEDAGIAYPYATATLPLQKKTAPGYANFHDTTGWANVSVPTSDKSANGAMAFRKGPSLGTGFDYCHDHAKDEWSISSVAANVRTQRVALTSTGTFIVGINTVAPTGKLHVADNDPKIFLEDTGGDKANWSVRNADKSFIIRDESNGTDRLRIDSGGSTIVGSAVALATNATDGFLYIPAGDGAPTGTPTAQTGKVPLYYDRTGHRMYVNDGGWKSVTLA